MLRKDTSFHSKYELISKLGDGSYGVVYKAKNKSTRKIVAIKIIKKNKHSDKEYLVYEYLKLQSDSQTDEPVGRDNVLYIFDVFQISQSGGEFIYMNMKYSPGITLDKINGKITPAQKINLAKQIFYGLQYLHSLKIAHCDIKDKNIIWDSETQKAVIIDLGNCCMYEPDEKYKIYNYKYTIALTRDYACPLILQIYQCKITCKYFEMFPQGDIWSACLTLILLTHKYPFPNGWYSKLKSTDDWFDHSFEYLANWRKNTTGINRLLMSGLVKNGTRPSAQEMIGLIEKMGDK